MLKRSMIVVTMASAVLLVISGCGLAPSVVKVFPNAIQHPENFLQPLMEADFQRPVPTMSPESLEVLETFQRGFTEVYHLVSPSVVNIQVEKISVGTGLMFPDFPGLPEFREFSFAFPTPNAPREFHQSGVGSGFVWDTAGHIVTNNHVVDGADEIKVTFADGTQAKGTLIGADPQSDLAVIQVDIAPARLHPIHITDSTQAEVGQLSIAIGNPFGLDGTMTIGVISALGRSLPVHSSTQDLSYTIPDVIQTDAPINPGNSGGVLVDIHGDLLGVTTAIQSPSGSNAGIGFVIPTVIVSKVVPTLIEAGVYLHPWIGISGMSLTSELAAAMNLDQDLRGALVIDVNPNSPAEAAGLVGSDRLATIDEQEVRVGGDVISRVDGQPINDFEDLVAFLARSGEVGQTITLSVIRNGETQTVDLTLDARPGELTAETESRRPEHNKMVWLGIQGINMNSAIAEAMGLPFDQQGVLVRQIYEGSPADLAGLRGSYKTQTIDGEFILVGGDVIIAVEGTHVTDLIELQVALPELIPSQELSFTILRNGRQMNVIISIEPLP